MSANSSSRIGLKVFAVLVVLAAAGAAVWYALRPVAQVVAVTKGRADDVVPGTVVVIAEKTSEIKSEAEGRLRGSELFPGKDVKEGETLAQIDPTDLDLEIAHAESELDVTKKNIEIGKAISQTAEQNANDDLEKSTRLHDRQIMADADFTRVKRAFEDLKQQRSLADVANQQKVENAESQLKVLRRKREKMTIIAPFDGVIAQVFVNKGDLINDKQALANLITRTMIVQGKISEENFARIKVGQPATVSFLGYADQPFKATVTKKLPTADGDTQRYIVYLDVQIAPEKLLPNLTGEVGIVVDSHNAEALVPRRALSDGCVYVVEDGRVRKQPVETGFVSMTYAEITKGVKPGALVIVEELETFRDNDGARVRTELVK